MKKAINWTISKLQQQTISTPQWVSPPRTETVPTYVFVLIALLFAALYFAIGTPIRETGALGKVDIFFGADVNWTIGDLTDPGANHYRTNTLTIGHGLPDGIHTVQLKILSEQPDRRNILAKRPATLEKFDLNPEAYDGTTWSIGGIMIQGDLAEQE